MAGHTPTGTVHIEQLADDDGEPTGQQVAVSTVVCTCGHKARLKAVTKKPVTPTAEEVAANPRSRSARLRAAAKLVEKS